MSILHDFVLARTSDQKFLILQPTMFNDTVEFYQTGTTDLASTTALVNITILAAMLMIAVVLIEVVIELSLVAIIFNYWVHSIVSGQPACVHVHNRWWRS